MVILSEQLSDYLTLSDYNDAISSLKICLDRINGLDDNISGSIVEKLSVLIDTKNSISAVIAEKGIFVPFKFGNYSQAISSIVQLSAQSLEETLTANPQTFTPTGNYNAISSITLSVDSSIDPNLIAENIKDGVTILGVTGTYTGS